MCFDVMSVNSIAFAVSLTRAINFCTAEALPNRPHSSLAYIGSGAYSRRGLAVSNVAVDNEFASLEAQLSDFGIGLNVVSRGEHVPEIERHIRKLKERCRATFSSLPFTTLPPRMVIEFVYAMTFWIHAFPGADGVTRDISPR